MNDKRVIKLARQFAEPYRITKGKGFHLKDFDPADTAGLRAEAKPRAKELLSAGVRLVGELQERLYAQNTWAVLLIFQGMDAAGKDGAVKHVMSGVNPMGTDVHAFKAPSAEELDHNFLWRCAKALPERGRIGIFNRSYYEETLIVRIHPEILESQRLPPALVTESIWSQRFDDINNFEQHLSRNGVLIRKFFLHVSREEQRRRFLERIDDPAKNWKFSIGDVRERGRWEDYMDAYEDAIRNTATEVAPWYVVPADNKWFTRLVIGAAVVDALDSLDLSLPELSLEQKAQLAAARKALLKE